MKVKAAQVGKAYKAFRGNLTEKEEQVLTKYYGLEKEVRHSLQEIADMYGVTRERIRQIKVEALEKLKMK